MDDETIECPHCQGLVNARVVHCPHCGGEVCDDAPSLEPTCPRCGVRLEHHELHGQDLDLCPTCSGLWLDRGEFRAVTRESDVYGSEPVPQGARIGPLRDLGGYVPCVRCGRLMNRKNFAKISNVILDECKRHGVWLDGGELERIRAFIADGGLERSQDREIERTRDELRELANTTQNVRFAQRAMHFFNWKRWFFTGW